MELLDWLRAAAALAATLALIAGAAYAARRFGMLDTGAHKPNRRLKVVESLMLDPRRRLVVVRFDDRDHLVLLSPAGDRPLAAVAAKEEPQP